MKKEYTVEFLRDEVSRIIAGTMVLRRSHQLPEEYDDEMPPLGADPATWNRDDPIACFLSSPPTEPDIDEFIAQCPFENDEIAVTLLGYVDADSIDLDEEEFDEFISNVNSWSGVTAWLAADDWPVVINNGELLYSSKFVHLRQTRYSREQLAVSGTQIEIANLSPSFGILERLLRDGVDIDALTWRQLEELTADLLSKDGYSVELGPGKKDGGIDIVAVKNLGSAGLFKAVWQAKKLKPGNKVGISVIRELADTRSEQKASKGIVITTTYLTKGALERVKRDSYILGKIDREDLTAWIERVLRGR